VAANLSKTQVDRLGDRLREGPPSESDVKLLDEYRRSFGQAYETVVGTVRDQLHLEPTGRPAKSTSSLIEKLHRESIRLSQVQDIAGCRVVVADVAEQERVIGSLREVFPGVSVVDRRANPNYGYRAVHVIPRISGKLIEIQVRTPLQHLWAELSEKLSDVFDPAIKYGGGLDVVRKALARTSESVAGLEKLETDIAQLQVRDVDEEQKLQELREGVRQKKKELADMCSDVISRLEQERERQQ
jgi:ppGpp synthetase/RelA/SpoT-type nucleotidyltranferase